MEILSLNVTGASFLAPETSDHEAKLEEFKKVVSQKFPILCLSGTRLIHEPGEIDGYELVVWRPAYKRTEGSGTPSGGLAVYRNKDANCVLETDAEKKWHNESCQNDNNGACKFCRFFLPFKLTYNGEEIPVCLVYLPPYTGDSKDGYKTDFGQMVQDGESTDKVPFRVLNNVLEKLIKQTKNVIVIGDMNAKTNTWNLSHERRSRDKSTIDNFGRHLINLCINQKLKILNGCTTKFDSEGEFTKGRHVYDYALVHTEMFNKYDFRVLDIDLDQSFFRHRPIVVKIGKYEKKDEEKDNQARAAEGDDANLAKGVEDIDLSPK